MTPAAPTPGPPQAPQSVAVIGAGIAGLSAAWLLCQAPASRIGSVTLFEQAARAGGHSHTVEAPGRAGGAPIPVDMGFIVYNEANYPNLTAMFDHIGAPTKLSDMSFAVSLDDGRLEYGGNDVFALFAQWRNLVRPRFWSMLGDLVRFYREAPGQACALDSRMTSLGDYLGEEGYGRAFQDDHLLPQAAAIWSASVGAVRDLPAAAFIRFCENHGLLQILNRPVWRTVDGGSREYVRRLTAAIGESPRGALQLGDAVKAVRRGPEGVWLRMASGRLERFDQVVIATHADQGLALLEAPDAEERARVGAFAYTRNLAVLHTDPALMPRRRRTWSAWNYVGQTRPGGDRELCVTYWMNRLQGLPAEHPLFVTLNPARAPDPVRVIRTEVYEHPLFDAAAMRAQKHLWSLQGRGGVWWCGAWFGAGFHEDGLQSGLAVAEALGGARRPWAVERESGRIHLPPEAAPPLERVA
ncbi:NAD(P)/FAD-dependent oxidoreductase [Caulobacter sp. KR2-114]|uniref:NAD(P)/FAD-dependent oxidoreductase n=1 Tax=Caulobacter sp. KR2-114 TaxID=3400912 RepID=UPI003C0587A7